MRELLICVAIALAILGLFVGWGFLMTFAWFRWPFLGAVVLGMMTLVVAAVRREQRR